MTDTPLQQRRGARAIVLCLVALTVLTLADLWTKDWAASALARDRTGELPAVCTPDEQGRYYYERLRTEPLVIVDGFLELRYAENCGAAFGMLDEAPKWLRVSLFMTAGFVAVAALMWMFIVGNGGVLFAWSVPLVVSGAIGNLVDRVRYGYVIDFIRVYRGSLEWPTFNVADSTITVGVALLLLDGFRRPAPRKSVQTAEAPNSPAT